MTAGTCSQNSPSSSTPTAGVSPQIRAPRDPSRGEPPQQQRLINSAWSCLQRLRQGRECHSCSRGICHGHSFFSCGLCHWQNPNRRHNPCSWQKSCSWGRSSIPSWSGTVPVLLMGSYHHGCHQHHVQACKSQTSTWLRLWGCYMADEGGVQELAGRSFFTCQSANISI